MSTWIDGSETGDFAFTDSDGLPRFRGRTCNLYGSAADALTAFSRQLKRGATIYVYRTRDGLYDGRVHQLPDGVPVDPEMAGAELVQVIDPTS